MAMLNKPSFLMMVKAMCAHFCRNHNARKVSKSNQVVTSAHGSCLLWEKSSNLVSAEK